jgi:hypothetical protein
MGWPTNIPRLLSTLAVGLAEVVEVMTDCCVSAANVAWVTAEEVFAEMVMVAPAPDPETAVTYALVGIPVPVIGWPTFTGVAFVRVRMFVPLVLLTAIFD